MPIYEYKCQNCGQVSQFLKGVSQEEDKLVCKHCGGRKLEKIFPQSFISMGGGSKDLPNRGICCGRDELCGEPPCSDNGMCKR